MTSKLSRIILIVVVGILLLLCAIVAGTYWAVGPALRCNRPAQGPAEPGWSFRTVISDGLERCYYLYAPPSYDPAQPAPLVLSFHGFLSNPNSHALITKWHQLADEEGFLVVYPQGTQFPQQWEAGPAWGTGVDDVQFFLDMLTDVSAVASVDPTRIYVNGFSNGGGMTEFIGCEAADQVAAMGTVAAAVATTKDCDPARPVPAMVFHGTADPVVIYDGGKVKHRIMRLIAESVDGPTNFVAAKNWVDMWAQHSGCDPTLKVMDAPEGVRGWHTTGCDEDADVFFYAVEGGGHTWPGGLPIPGVGKTSNKISATEEMWRFFKRHSLDAQP
jgi:polyhydroxybutyrate depolymerase